MDASGIFKPFARMIVLPVERADTGIASVVKALPSG
jgi:hypothetical protein